MIHIYIYIYTGGLRPGHRAADGRPAQAARLLLAQDEGLRSIFTLYFLL